MKQAWSGICLLALTAALATASGKMAFADRADNNDILHDVEWNVVQIGENALDAGSPRPVLKFSSDGSFSGKACNSFRGTYTMNGAEVTFGPAAATKMACAEPVMQQEQNLFQAFENVATYTITDDGSLLLKDRNGVTLVTAR